jgi:hypothetical protein
MIQVCFNKIMIGPSQNLKAHRYVGVIRLFPCVQEWSQRLSLARQKRPREKRLNRPLRSSGFRLKAVPERCPVSIGSLRRSLVMGARVGEEFVSMAVRINRGGCGSRKNDFVSFTFQGKSILCVFGLIMLVGLNGTRPFLAMNGRCNHREQPAAFISETGSKPARLDWVGLMISEKNKTLSPSALSNMPELVR